MRSEEEIRERLEQLKNRYEQLDTGSERSRIARQINQLEWVLDE